MAKTDRLLALDVMRGITISAMILVNNPAVWGKAYAPLQHAAWHGLTPTDLIYPFFVFIMGISGWLSLSKRYEGPTRAGMLRILRRSAVIFAIGVGLQLFSGLVFGTSRYLLVQAVEGASWLQTAFPMGTFRILGVLQGLALAYLFGAAALVVLRFRHLVATAAVLLAVYWLLLALGNGFELSADNIIAVVDRALLGENHLYMERLADGSRLGFEPEGLLSTLPRIAQFLLGAAAGRMLTQGDSLQVRLNRLFVFGAALVFAGLLLQYGCPLNKKIWSSSFALATSGFGALLLGVLVWTIDVRRRTGWTGFFRAFGVNPLFLYVLAWIGSVLTNVAFRVGGNTVTVKGWFYTTCIDPFCGPAFGSLVWSLLFVGLIWLPGLLLYRKKIYIKI